MIVTDKQNLPEALSSPDVGGADWWQDVRRRGTPFVETLDADRAHVLFLWRDPYGDESRSPLRRVYIDVNGVTDHHDPDPQSLTRLAGSDVWFWQIELPADWRGSYVLMPADAAQTAPAPVADPEEQREQHRRWWLASVERAEADPLNPLPTFAASWCRAISQLHLPRAPSQSLWFEAQDYPPQRLTAFEWDSALLGNRRRVWLYQTGEADAERPLVLLLDGQHWAANMPVYPALEALTRSGRLPPAVYLLIDSLDGRRRSEELPCAPIFWQALQAELLPQVARSVPFSTAPERTVVAGQSFGGLAALYAGLHWPERFGRVLSQSGSFWWPKAELLDAAPGEASVRKPGSRGWLAETLAARGERAGTLRVFMEVGSREDVMIDVNDSMHAALLAAGHRVRYRRFEGGHDWLCWRGGLLEGLEALLAE